MTDPISPAYLEKLKALCEAAREGPWRWESAALLAEGQLGRAFEDCILRTLGNCGPFSGDEHFIAAARAAMPRLIAWIGELEDFAQQRSDQIHVDNIDGEHNVDVLTCEAPFCVEARALLGEREEQP